MGYLSSILRLDASGDCYTWFISSFFGINEFGIPFELDWHGFLKLFTLQEAKGLTWSIAVEFKFYFILPLLVFLVLFISSYHVGSTLLFFLILLLLFQLISPPSQSTINDANLLPYMPIFVFGISLAFFQSHINNGAKFHKRLFKVIGYVGVVGIVIMTPLVFSILIHKVPENYFHKQFILHAIFWSFILFSAVNVRGLIQDFFSLPILRFYGALSFSLYLFHPIFIGTLVRFKLNTYFSAWLVLLLSTVSAYISFKVIENPVSKFKITRSLLSTIFPNNVKKN